MPLDLKAMLKQRATVEVSVPGLGPDGAAATLNLTYNPHSLTSAIYNDFLAYRRADGFDDAISLLSRLVIDWDVVSDGKKVKPDAEALSQLPINALSAMILGIIGHVTNPQSPEDSQPI